MFSYLFFVVSFIFAFFFWFLIFNISYKSRNMYFCSKIFDVETNIYDLSFFSVFRLLLFGNLISNHKRTSQLMNHSLFQPQFLFNLPLFEVFLFCLCFSCFISKSSLMKSCESIKCVLNLSLFCFSIDIKSNSILLWSSNNSIDTK